MSDSQTNLDSEGTNGQPPVAGQAPRPGVEVGSHAPQHFVPPAAPGDPTPSAGYDHSAPWKRPASETVPQAYPHAHSSSGQSPTYGSPGIPSPDSPASSPASSASSPDSSASPPYGSDALYGSGVPGAPPQADQPAAEHPTGQTTWIGVPAGSSNPPAPENMTWPRAVVAIVAGAALALFAGGVGGFVGYALHGDNGSSVQTVVRDQRNGAPVVDRSSLASIAKAMQPAVVSVKTSVGEGSGIVISSDGYIVTNNHVVADATGATVEVTFNSGKILPAKIVGTDAKTDIAVVKTDTTGLIYATFGDSDAVQVGDTVLAIGSPLGLQGSVTAGIVSALHRTITVGGQQQSQFQAPAGTTTIGDAIQTDAPINQGNSGGALVDTNGKVVGINSAIATSGSTGSIGVGFAISSNKVKSVSDQLIKGGKVSHPYLGISLGEAQNGGAQVQSVAAGSPAAVAGIEQGDVITKVGDRLIATSEDLVGAVQSSVPGATMNLTVVRNGSERTVTATVGDQP
jgi:putative serine protease PepD